MRSLLVLIPLLGAPGLGDARPNDHVSYYFTATCAIPPLQSRQRSDLRLLRSWLPRELVEDPEELAEAAEALTRLDLTWDSSGAQHAEAREVLLDFLGRSIALLGPVEPGDPLGTGALFGARSEDDLRRRTSAILRRRLPELRSWLTRDVLLRGEANPLRRRVAACEVLALDQSPEVVLALFSSTRAAPTELLDACVAALAGRDRPEVHQRLIELLSQAERGEIVLWRRAIEAHFQALTLRKDQRELCSAVSGYVGWVLASSDWRGASRGIAVARCLPHEEAFPLLIGGLEHWNGLAEEGRVPVRRVLGELEGELERRSGRNLGPRPERWKLLFEGYRRGDVTLTSRGGQRAHLTRAGFFGLRPETDRVTFVIDRSGSMATEIHTGERRSRLEEATLQLGAFLTQLGPQTRFNVVIFSNEAASWKRELRPANESNIASARSWVLQNGPEGGTSLVAGVRAAMAVDSRGRLDLEALEADTVIVLCDGATSEGPHWVRPLLRRVNDQARVVFHTVQLGYGGDGTLQLLAEETGGEFVRVDG